MSRTMEKICQTQQHTVCRIFILVNALISNMNAKKITFYLNQKMLFLNLNKKLFDIVVRQEIKKRIWASKLNKLNFRNIGCLNFYLKSITNCLHQFYKLTIPHRVQVLTTI